MKDCLRQKHSNFGKPCKIQIGGNPAAHLAEAICGSQGCWVIELHKIKRIAARKATRAPQRAVLPKNVAPEATEAVSIVGTPFVSMTSV
jgi:hypothetical protein